MTSWPPDRAWPLGHRSLTFDPQVHLVPVLKTESGAQMQSGDHLHDGQGVVPGPGVVPVGAKNPARLVIETAGDETHPHADLRGFKACRGLMHDPRFFQHDVQTSGL